MTSQFAEFKPRLPLTDREMEVLNAIAAGNLLKEVARSLHVPQNTIKNHVRNIIEKLRLFPRHVISLVSRSRSNSQQEQAPRFALALLSCLSR